MRKISYVILKVDIKHPLDNDMIEVKGGYTFRIRAVIHDNLKGAVIDASDTLWKKLLKK